MLTQILKNVLGSLVMSLGVIFFAKASLLDPRLSPLVGSAVRVTCNLSLTLGLYTLSRIMGKKVNLWGHKKAFLLLWGALGTATIICYFNAVAALGVATAGFMLNASGSLLVLIHYCLAFGTVPFWQLISALFCLVGAGLLGLGPSGFQFQIGFHWGLLAALAAGAAYSVIGRQLRHEAVMSTTFYWGLLNVIIHFGLLQVTPYALPESWEVWLMLIGSGLLAAAGQYWVNASFQTSQSSLMGIISYLNCVVAMLLDIWLLGRTFSKQQYLGASLIVITSVVTLLLNRILRLAPDSEAKQSLEQPSGA